MRTLDDFYGQFYFECSTNLRAQGEPKRCSDKKHLAEFRLLLKVAASLCCFVNNTADLTEKVD